MVGLFRVLSPSQKPLTSSLNTIHPVCRGLGFRVYGPGLKSLELGIGLRKTKNPTSAMVLRAVSMHKPYIHRNLNSKPSTVSLLQHENLCTTFRSLVALQ